MPGETLPRHYVFGFIIFTMAIMVGVSILTHSSNIESDFFNGTDADDFAKFNKTVEKYSELTDSVDTLKSGSQAQPEEGLFENLGVLGSLINTAWKSLLLLYTSFTFIPTMFVGIAEILPIPGWVAGLVILLITVLIAFAIFTVIFQREI